jgi:hypothetical protein
LLLLILSLQPSTFAQGTAFTYQGRLNNGGTPVTGVYDLSFTLYNSLDLPDDVIAGPITNSATGITNGIFTVTLDFGAGIFSGAVRLLEIGVRTNGVGAFVTLSPKQPLTPAPNAFYAGNAGALQNNGVTGLRVQALPNTASLSNVVNLVGGSPKNVASGIGATVAGGGASVSGFDFPNTAIADYGTISGGGANLVTSGYGTIGGGWGNTANGIQGATIGGGYFNTASGNFSAISAGQYNIASGAEAFIGGGQGNLASGFAASIGGGTGNAIQAGSTNSVINGGFQNAIASGGYATIGGGFQNSGGGFYSTVAGGVGCAATNYAATVSGGEVNSSSGISSTVSGGSHNAATNSFAAIGGGAGNTAGDFAATVGGGQNNIASGPRAVVGGGRANIADANAAAIGGGSENHASGDHAFIAGGQAYIAGGAYSFAAGQQAQALHQGAFVWADSQIATFSSTAIDSFNVRARGGASFVTSGAGLLVDGGAVAVRTAANTFSAGQTFNGSVGIGTPSPQAQFNVNGTARVDATTLGWNEGLTLNLPTDMPGGGYGGIHFHNAARGGAYGSGTIKWGMFYNYTPEGGVAGNGLSFVQSNLNTRLYISTNGNVGIGTNTPQQKLHVNGNILASGTITGGSDRNIKEHFANVDPRQVLEKVAALPISRWNYKEDAEVPHVGPMAQDFFAAFNVGMDDKHISMVDADGVALAAIQGLNQKVDERDAEIKNLNHQNDSLERRLNQMEALLKQLTNQK